MQIATRPTWALQNIPPEGCCIWRKQLGSPGRAELPWASWAARISLLELLINSEPHRALLVKVLNEAHVALDILVEGFEGIVNHITTNNYIAFVEEEILVEGRGREEHEILCSKRALKSEVNIQMIKVEKNAHT